MGLVSAGDEFNQRTDEALKDLENLYKLVDDLLVATETEAQHKKAVRALLKRCRETDITLNPDKMVLGQDEVKFAGYIIGKDGVKADPEKTAAIRNFPKPKNITDLRSFQGLVEQLGGFSTQVAEAMGPLRPLLSPRADFIWTDDHDKAFKAAKEALSAPPVLTTFDPTRETQLETDAARTKGLGYVLRQKSPEGQWKMIEAGSRFITEAESRYSMVELELLGAVWAMKKCKMYLAGLQHFNLITDHLPLRSILDKKTLDQIETPRILRLKMALTPYNFSTEWKEGKKNAIPDALSRSPCQAADEEDEQYEQELKRFSGDVTMVASIAIEREGDFGYGDPILKDIMEHAEKDQEYQDLARAIMEDKELPPGYKGSKLMLTVNDGCVLSGQRLVIPKALRKETLKRLHASHQGIERTLQRARKAVFWPGISNDIRSTVEACQACQTMLPSQRKEPMEWDTEPTRIYEEVAVDFFEANGKHFMAMIDRFSGYPTLAWFPKAPTADMAIERLMELFSTFGCPRRIFSDGGPQFTAHNMQDFLKRWGVSMRVSTPGYAQSNGLAESAVKTLKHLVIKCGVHRGEAIREGLLELRNTPSKAGKCPAEIVFGCPMRSRVPAHWKSFKTEWLTSMDEYDAKAARLAHKRVIHYDKSSRTLPPIKLN